MFLEGFFILGLIVQSTRKQAEEELRRKDDILEEAQGIAHLGSWSWDIMTNEVSWSDEVYRIFGMLPQDFGTTHKHFLERTHPDDREQVLEAVKRALADPETSYNIMHRIIRMESTDCTRAGTCDLR